MSAAIEVVADCLSDQVWGRLMSLESLHRQIQRNHEQVIRKLDEATVSSDRRDLLVAWNQYRAVVADLSRVTEDIGSIRLSV